MSRRNTTHYFAIKNTYLFLTSINFKPILFRSSSILKISTSTISFISRTSEGCLTNFSDRLDLWINPFSFIPISTKAPKSVMLVIFLIISFLLSNLQTLKYHPLIVVVAFHHEDLFQVFAILWVCQLMCILQRLIP